MRMPCRSLQNTKTFDLMYYDIVNSLLYDIFYLVNNDFDNEMKRKINFHVILWAMLLGYLQ